MITGNLAVVQLIAMRLGFIPHYANKYTYILPAIVYIISNQNLEIFLIKQSTQTQ